MAILNRAVVDAIATTYNTTFTTALEATPPTPLMDRLTMRTQSNGRQENYAWMLEFARMREWFGEREFTDAQVFEYFIKNRKFEGTIRTMIEDVEDGVYRLRAQSEIEQLAEAYADLQEDEIFRLLDTAFDNDGPDGVPFFSTAHPMGHMERVRANGADTWIYVETDTWSNRTTASFSADALWAARAEFYNMRDHLGRQSRRTPNLLVVGPSLEREARKVLGQAVVVEDVGGTPLVVPNDTQGAFELLVEPRIDDGRWFLFDTTRRLKPFIYQERVPVQFQRVGAVNPEGDVEFYTFNTDAILFGARARFGVGYGVPALAYGSVGDDS